MPVQIQFNQNGRLHNYLLKKIGRVLATDTASYKGTIERNTIKIIKYKIKFNI